MDVSVEQPPDRYARLAELLGEHGQGCACAPCRRFREQMTAIEEAERDAWKAARDVYIR